MKDGKDPGNEESIIYNSAAVLATRRWASEDNVQPLATNLYLRDKLPSLAAFLVSYVHLLPTFTFSIAMNGCQSLRALMVRSTCPS